MSTKSKGKQFPPDKGGKGGYIPYNKNLTQKARINNMSTKSKGKQFPPDKGGKGGYIPYNKNLTQKARINRKNPTPAEQKLWHEVLQGKRLDNLKFTRQKPLDEYIVDFYCAELACYRSTAILMQRSNNTIKTLKT